MAKDPAFLFYPGDYLRDTQNLSEKSQVAYDRIMCEHMRNICEDMNKIMISKKQVDFFIKRLNDEEKEELFFVLTEMDDNYQIEWIAESIAKRKSYSNSRAKNREGKNKEDMRTYDLHMENENENENKDEIIIKKTLKKRKIKKFIVPEIKDVKQYFKEKGYTEQSAIKFYEYYSVSDWVDSKGSNIINWKQKAQGVWFKDENKIQNKVNGNPKLSIF